MKSSHNIYKEKNAINNYKEKVLEHSQAVTVFMLTYNREVYLKKAINSVISQTYKNFTLFILDNCSVDNTESMILSFSDSRIVYLRRESKEGDSNTEFAQKVCITPFFIILHDDDILEDRYLETVLNEMINNNYVALSVKNSIIDENDNIIKRDKKKRKNIIYKGDRYLKHIFTQEKYGFVYPSVIYRTSFYKDFSNFAGSKEIGPAGDQYIWLETERKGGVLCLYGEELIRYRIHKNQNSFRSRSFMSIKLYDYLLTNDYYYRKMKNNRFKVTIRIFVLFLHNMKDLLDKNIELKDVDDFLNYNTIDFIKKTLYGRIIYFLMRSIYYTFRFINLNN